MAKIFKCLSSFIGLTMKGYQWEVDIYHVFETCQEWTNQRQDVKRLIIYKISDATNKTREQLRFVTDANLQVSRVIKVTEELQYQESGLFLSYSRLNQV